ESFLAAGGTALKQAVVPLGIEQPLLVKPRGGGKAGACADDNGVGLMQGGLQAAYLLPEVPGRCCNPVLEKHCRSPQDCCGSAPGRLGPFQRRFPPPGGEESEIPRWRCSRTQCF